MTDLLTDPVIRRFWAKVDRIGDGCWVWKSFRNSKGYGRFGIPIPRDRRCGARQVIMHTHRLSWILAFGLIPDGLWVLHKCDVPSCVRPAHLFLGNARTNNRDCASKGRRPAGETHSSSKLTNAQVVEIRRRVASGDETHSGIALDYGVCAQTVSKISRGKAWRHLQQEAP